MLHNIQPIAHCCNISSRYSERLPCYGALKTYHREIAAKEKLLLYATYQLSVIHICLFHHIIPKDYQVMVHTENNTHKHTTSKESTVKPAHVVPSIKGSPVSSSHIVWSSEPKYSVKEHVLRGHLS